VALHRFLARRLPGYSPERHLGGICYFYVRGALLEGQGPDAGLATWRIPVETVIGVSDLLAGRRDG
jgi:exodeoxyribonuclease V beta subunit